MARVPSMRPQPTVGWPSGVRGCLPSPVPAFWAAWPTAKKIADFTREWTVMWSSPAKLATGPPEIPKAKVISPMCSMEE